MLLQPAGATNITAFHHGAKYLNVKLAAPHGHEKDQVLHDQSCHPARDSTHHLHGTTMYCQAVVQMSLFDIISWMQALAGAVVGCPSQDASLVCFRFACGTVWLCTCTSRIMACILTVSSRSVSPLRLGAVRGWCHSHIIGQST